MNYKEFTSKLNRRKEFQIFPKQYQSNKFLILYYKMYNYMLSISKEKIKVISYVKWPLVNFIKTISYFIEAKDFYHWKERLYGLLTEKLCSTSKRKFELLYGSKAKDFFDQFVKKRKNTCVSKFGKTTNLQIERTRRKAIKNTQSKKAKEKRKATNLKIYGKENPMQSKEIQDKMKATNLDKRGVEYSFQSKEVREVINEKWKNKTKKEKEQIKEKRKNTNLKRYKVSSSLMLYQYHSKFGDEICTIIDNVLDNPEDSKYAIKNKE